MQSHSDKSLLILQASWFAFPLPVKVLHYSMLTFILTAATTELTGAAGRRRGEEKEMCVQMTDTHKHRCFVLT